MNAVCGYDGNDCLNACVDSGCTEGKLGDGVCDTGKGYAECNSEVCGWDKGDCGYCAKGCMEGMLGNGVCETECYQSLCGYDSADCVDSGSPLSVYVSPTATAPFLGTSAAPYQSVSQVFTTLSAVSYLHIYLLSGTHLLTTSTTNYNLLFSTTALSIHIETALCSQGNIPSCSDTPVTIQLTPEPVFFLIKMPFSITNVNFKGGFSLKPGCVSETCLYCPELTFDLATDQWQNDKEEDVDPANYAVQSLCDAYHSLVLFSIQPDTAFTLTNVSFSHIRHQPLSLIQSTCGVVSLSNVTFSNIQVASMGLRGGVIQWVRLNSRLPYYCGSFRYETGLVEYLNNGYEFCEHAHFSGFAYFSAIQEVVITDVRFQFNDVFVGEAATATSSSLIFIEELRQIHVSKCEFLNNVADMGAALYINSAVTIPIINENGVSKEHNLLNIWIEKTRFEHNTARIGATVVITFTEEHQNVWIDDCSFVGNLAWEREILGVFTVFLTADMSTYTIKRVGSGSGAVDVLVPPSYVNFTNLYIADNRAPYVCYIRNIGVLQLANTTFLANGDLISDTELTENPVLMEFLDNPDSYVDLPPDTDIAARCVSSVYVYKGMNVKVSNVTVESGYCATGSAGLNFVQGLNEVKSI